jgi:glycosyltransferase involved in cell wall biosynthesis
MKSIMNLGKHIPRSSKLLNNSLDFAGAITHRYPDPSKSNDKLIILDDIFPSLVSAFRIAEYNAYLETFESAEVHSTGSAFASVRETRSFPQVVAEYEQYYPQFKKRVFKFNRWRSLQSRLMYTIFLNNAFYFADMIKKYNVSFVFTLYPGGGFQLGIEESDAKLQKVCSLPNLKKIIVTQKVSKQYLLEQIFCGADKVEFIYGGVLPSDRLIRNMVTKKYYMQDKNTFDICFVANKSMKRGIDKGYDVFIEVARFLSKMHQDILFHVVGPYDRSDIHIKDIDSKVKFYGIRYTDFFSEFYSRMDIILSPNIPFAVGLGSFDGFPTGACVEAGLCGVAVFCTDVLGQNIAFKNGDEIVIISRDVEEISSIMDEYYRNYDDLILLGKKGQEAFKRVFDIEAQMKPRLEILSAFMA